MNAKPFPFKPCYTLAEIDALPPAKLHPRPPSPIGASMKEAYAFVSWGEAPAFITEKDFPRYGITPFARPAVAVEILQPKSGEDQWVFRLGGIVPSFLRVQYIVVPKYNAYFQAENERELGEVWGEVHPLSAELLVEHDEGTYQVVAEFESRDIPWGFKRLEAKRRPSAEKIGWTREDLLEVLGNAADSNE